MKAGAPTGEHATWVQEAIGFIESLNSRVPPHVRFVVIVSTNHAEAKKDDDEQCAYIATRNVAGHLDCVLGIALEAVTEGPGAPLVETRH